MVKRLPHLRVTTGLIHYIDGEYHTFLNRSKGDYTEWSEWNITANRRVQW